VISRATGVGCGPSGRQGGAVDGDGHLVEQRIGLLLFCQVFLEELGDLLVAKCAGPGDQGATVPRLFRLPVLVCSSGKPNQNRAKRIKTKKKQTQPVKNKNTISFLINI
jgi:hypothetical protein